MSESRRRAWSLLTLPGEERVFQGNDGYQDITGSSYHYDSRVANSRHVTVGDMAMIRDGRSVLGFGLVSSIQLSVGDKLVRTCPKCGSSKLGRRKVKLPEYKCQTCRFETDTPIETLVSVGQFVAEYGSSWMPVEAPLAVDTLVDCYVSKAIQHAIRELRVSSLLRHPQVGDVVAALWPEP